MDRKKIQDQIDEARRVVVKVEALIVELESELAKKPELRHGDYGYGKDNSQRITLSCDRKMVTAGNASVNNTNAVSNEKYYPSPILGNIFDDLKAMGEDLTEFKVSGLDVGWSEGGLIEIKNGLCQAFYINPDDLSAFIRNLRIMEATLLRKRLDK